MLPKENRLTKKKFQSINQGNKYRGEYGMFIFQSQNEPTPTFGFIVSKKIGNAVQRHRMTRLLREIVKKYLKDFKYISGIYIAYKYCNDYEKLEKDTSIHIHNAIRDFKTDRANSN